MNEGDVWTLLKTLIPTFVGVNPADLHADTVLMSLGVESLDLVELQVEVQKRLGVKLTSAVFASGEVKTLGELVAYIDGLRASAA
jgi:acyl carrier protein